ncbi:MAG: hypothetical protein AAGF81_17690 [Pseudomonadota bacterium]
MKSPFASVWRSTARVMALALPTLAGASSLSWAETQEDKFKKILAQADSAYGEYLAGQCVTCHAPSGAAQGIPHIHGLPDVYLVQTMLEYKTGIEGRTNPAMVNIAKNLSDEELGSLAKYFSEQKSTQ